MLLIGFTGKKGCGKNEAADVALTSFGILSVAFADPLRRVCSSVFRLTPEEMGDRKLKETPLTRWPFKSPREIMQIVGTNMFRKEFPDVWIEYFKHKARVYEAHGVKALAISDVRFVNEADAIRELGGVIIRIERGFDGVRDKHPSETEMDLIRPDFVVVNDGGLGEFRERVRLVLGEVLK